MVLCCYIYLLWIKLIMHLCGCIQQGGQLLSTAGGNVYNVVQPMQTVTVDGQEALFIPASQQQQLQLGGQTLITPSGQVIRSPNIIPASLLQGQTLQFPGGMLCHYIFRTGQYFRRCAVCTLQKPTLFCVCLQIFIYRHIAQPIDYQKVNSK